MKNVVIAILAIALAVMTWIAYQPALKGMQESKCDEIIRTQNFYTKKNDLVCEIKMHAEDDNLRIFKGQGAIDDNR